MPFEVLEHRADAGIRVSGATVEEVFVSAAAGMFHVISEEPPPGWDESRKLYMEAGDAAGLLVDWLSELLFLLEVKHFWVTGTSVNIIEERIEEKEKDKEGKGRGEKKYILEAEVKGLRFSGSFSGTEIKAVTYHKLEIIESAEGYETEIYFDL